MSSFEALALLVTTVLFGSFVFAFILGKTLLITSIVETGSVDGVPVSIEYRRRLVWYWYFGVQNAGVGILVFAALVLVWVGKSVDDPTLQNLLYLVATINGMAALAMALGMASEMSYHLKLLRKEEEN